MTAPPPPAPPPRGLQLVCAGLALTAIGVLPMLSLQPNRIVNGVGWRLWEWPDPVAPWLSMALLGLAVLGALTSRRLVSIASAGIGAVGLLVAASLMAGDLLPEGRSFARASLGAGFWVGVLAFVLLSADGFARLSLRPLMRVALAVSAVAVLVVLLASGLCDDLSIMREYRSYRDTFWTEAGRHLVLVSGSLGPAILLGIPLGYLCHRVAAVRAAALPVLEVVQTIPSLAMFGLLMAPLAALAVAVPFLGAIGVRGIGTAPAIIALFLYSLLPIVANTVAGFDEVDRNAREAARGMGMGPVRRLLWVEWPLAQPVILTGIRIVLVQNVGLAAVAAMVGGGGLGTFVFRGMDQTAMDLVLLGAVPIIVVALTAAITLDALVDHVKERRLRGQG